MLFGNSIFFIPVHLRNAQLSICITLFDNLTSFRFVHPSNADSPISVTVSGISIFSIPVQFLNIALSILVIPSSKVTVFNEEHPLKGPSSYNPPPTNFIFFGILTDLKFTHLAKALFPISATLSGILAVIIL